MKMPDPSPHRQTHRLIASAVLGVVLCCLILGLIWRSVSQRMGHARPQQLWGDWRVVGLQGDDRGVVTFLPNGLIDCHDDYSGTWWRDNEGMIHVQFWDRSPDSLMNRLRPDKDEFIFIPEHAPAGSPAALQGENVVLSRGAR